MTRKITFPKQTVSPKRLKTVSRKIRTYGELPTPEDAPLRDIPVVTNAMFQQDIEPHSESFDVLTTRLAQKLPEWTKKEGSPGARAAAFLRTMRNAAGLSQANLGERARIKQSDISSLENSDSPQGPSFDVMARVADACGFYLTFEAKSGPKSKHRVTHGVSAVGGKVRHSGGRCKIDFVGGDKAKRPVCYVLLPSGELKEFKGTSPELKRDGKIIVKDRTGHLLEVNVEAPKAKVEIKAATPSIAAAVHLREGR